MLFHAKIVVKRNPAKLKGLSKSMSAILKLTGISVLALTKNIYSWEHFLESYFLFICSQSVFFSSFDELFKISIVKPCDKNATLSARDVSTRKAKSLQLVSGIYLLFIYIKPGRYIYIVVLRYLISIRMIHNDFCQNQLLKNILITCDEEYC